MENNNNLGQVKISNDVIVTIAGLAALEVEGVDTITSLTDKLLKNNGVKIQIEDGKVTQHSKTLVVRDIVNENNVYYILFEGVKGVEFTGSTEFFKELKWTHKGDTVSVSYVEGKETVIALDTFDNLNVEI